MSAGPGKPSAPPEGLARFASFRVPGDRGDLESFVHRLVQLIALILVLQVAGTIGFVLTEQVSVWDGYVWTVDTIATIGSIPDPEDTGGRLVKLVLIMLGVGTVFYALVTVAEFFVAGHMSEILRQRRTLRHISDLSDHHIVCGFGRVGRQVARDLRAAGERFVVIDRRPESRELASDIGAAFLLGTPSEDEVLREAGIERARSVVACVDSDAENIFVCLTARELRSDISIVARASVEDSEKKMLRAGANRVISPYKSSGAEMARLALHPQVAAAVDVAPEYRLEEIEVTEDCEGAGQAIGDLRGTALIAALRGEDGQVHPQPSSATVLKPGDVLVAMGTAEALTRLEQAFAPATGRRPAR